MKKRGGYLNLSERDTYVRDLYPYVSVWNAALQSEVYGSAWSMIDDVLESVGNIEMIPGMPYVISLDNETNVTWVGRVPQAVTFELSNTTNPSTGISGENYITLPLNTEIRYASQLCRICTDNTICEDTNKFILNQSKTIRE